MKHHKINPTKNPAVWDSLSSGTMPEITSGHVKLWEAIKQKYPQAIVLVRLADYYFALGKDAVTVSNILELEKISSGTLTVCYVEYPAALDNASYKLVKCGYQVAICDQLVSTPHY